MQKGPILLRVDHLGIDDITKMETCRAIRSLTCSFTTDPDLLFQFLLKNYPDVFAKPLCYIFNLSLKCSKFPTTKNGKLQNNKTNNHRATSVLSVSAKLFDRLLYCIQKYVHTQKKHITISQHGL